MICCPENWKSATPRERLDDVVASLGNDEIEVLARIALRLRQGAVVYGLLKLACDTRDFRKEAREEIEDFLVYLSCCWLIALTREAR